MAEVLAELKVIKKEIHDIKLNMVGADEVMTEEDCESLLSYRQEKKEGKLKSHRYCCD